MQNQKVFIYCKTVAKGQQAYYMHVDKKDYFLFIQNFRKSNKEIFGTGILLEDALDYSISHSTSVHKTMTKLIPFIKYIEKEYGLTVLRKTQISKNFNKKALPYNRQKFKTSYNNIGIA